MNSKYIIASLDKTNHRYFFKGVPDTSPGQTWKLLACYINGDWIASSGFYKQKQLEAIYDLREATEKEFVDMFHIFL